MYKNKTQLKLLKAKKQKSKIDIDCKPFSTNNFKKINIITTEHLTKFQTKKINYAYFVNNTVIIIFCLLHNLIGKFDQKKQQKH